MLNNNDANVARGPNDPVSVEFGGVAYELTRSKLENGEWSPVLAEWLDGSELRRVVAVPYSQEVGQAVARLKYGDILRLRLSSSEVVEYRLVDIAASQAPPDRGAVFVITIPGDCPAQRKGQRALCADRRSDPTLSRRLHQPDRHRSARSLRPQPKSHRYTYPHCLPNDHPHAYTLARLHTARGCDHDHH